MQLDLASDRAASAAPTSDRYAADELVELLVRFARRGIVITAEGPDLRIRCPRGALTAADRVELAERKPALVALLTVHPCTGCGRIAFAVPTRCFWCRQTTLSPGAENARD